MAKVVPPVPRVRMTENGEALHVVIPARRNWYVLISFAVWLICWPACEVLAVFVLVTGRVAGLGFLFVPLWLIGWTVAGVWVIFCWLWNLAGREEVIVDGNGDLSIRYAVFNKGKAWEFDRAALRNLRVAHSGTPPWYTHYVSGMGDANYLGIWHGPLAFDYGAKTYRFGAGMDEAEARDLLPHLLRRLSPDDPAPFKAHGNEH